MDGCSANRIGVRLGRVQPGLAAAAASLLLAAAGCSGRDSSKPAPTPAAALRPADFKTEVPIAELMEHVFQSAAAGVWSRQGWVYNAKGEQERFPATEAEWNAAEDSATTLAEVSNLLLMPGRVQGDDQAWIDYSHGLYDTAMFAKKAAAARDKVAFFEAGSDIYTVCRSCHDRFVVGETALTPR